MRTLMALTLAAVLLAGCAAQEAAPSEPEIPQAQDAPPAATQDLAAPPSQEAFVTVTVDLAGTIVLRPATDPIAMGDAPEFVLTVPPGARSLRAHGEWSPSQVMGLEFQPPDGERVRSWADSPNTRVHPPIDMALAGPLPEGEWWAYFGPSTVGGAVSWNLTLALEVPESQAAAVQVAGCPPQVLPAFLVRAC